MLTLRKCASVAMRRIWSDRRLRARLIAILTIGVGGWVASTPHLLHGLTRHYYDNSEWAGQPTTTVRDRTLRLEGSDFPGTARGTASMDRRALHPGRRNLPL